MKSHILLTLRKLPNRINAYSQTLVRAIAPTIVAAQILCFGGEIQRVIFRTIEGGQPNLYSSVYGSALIRFPSLADMLLSVWNIPLFVLGFVVMVWSLNTVDLLQTFRRMALGLFLSLMGLDLIYAVIQHDFSTISSFENLFSNGFGAMIVSAITLVICRLAMDHTTALNRGRASATTLARIVSIIYGSIVTYFIYQLILLCFNPISESVEIESNPSFNMFYSQKEMRFKPQSPYNINSDDNYITSEWQEFDPYPSDKTNGSVLVQGMSPAVRWASMSDETLYSADVSLYADCFGIAIDKLPKNESTKKINNLKYFDISTDRGVAYFQTGKLANSTYSTKLNEFGTFLWRSEGKDGSYSIDQFAPSRKSEFQGKLSDDFTIMAQMPLMGLKDKIPAIMPRSATIKYNGYSEQISFRRTSPLSRGPVHCHPLNWDEREVAAVGVAIVVKVHPILTDLADMMAEQIVTFRVERGDVRISGFPDNAESRRMLGDIGTVAGLGQVKRIVVGDKSVAVGADDKISAVGSMHGRYSKAGNFIVSGTAKMLWKNDDRLNRTRLESLPSDWIPWLAGGLFGLLVWAGRAGIQIFRRSAGETTALWVA